MSAASNGVNAAGACAALLWALGNTPASGQCGPSILYRSGGTVETVVGRDGLVYFGRGASLVVADTHDLDAPVELGRLVLPATVAQMDLSGDLLLVATGATPLLIVDVSDPHSMSVVGSYEAEGFVGGVDIDGPLACVGTSKGLETLDVRDPSHPVRIGASLTSEPFGQISLEGGRAVAKSQAGWFSVFDLSDPASPKQGAFLGGGLYSGAAIRGNLAYVALESQALFIYDVTNPLDASAIGSAPLPAPPRGVHLSGTLAYVADDHAGVMVFDVADPANPLNIGTLDTPGLAAAVFTIGGTLAVADDEEGLRLADVTEPRAPVLRGGLATPGRARGVSVQDNLVAVAAYHAPAKLFDGSDPRSPSLLSRFGDSSFGVILDGPTLFVSAFVKVAIADVSDPGAPRAIGELGDLPFPFFDMARTGDLLCLAGIGTGLVVADISDLSAPGIVGKLDHRDASGVVAAEGATAIIGDRREGITVVDLSTPHSPKKIASYKGAGTPPNDLALKDGLAYGVSLSTGLVIHDLTTPSAPKLLGSLKTTAGAYTVSVRGGLAYIGTYPAGLSIVDVSNPAAPIELSWRPAPSDGDIPVVSAETNPAGAVFAAAEGAGLLTFGSCHADCTCDTRLTINDFLCFQSEWRRQTAYGDYNGDGKWNINDFIAFQADFRKGC